MNNPISNNNILPPDFFSELKKLFAEMLKFSKGLSPAGMFSKTKNKNPGQFDESVSLTQLMLRNFEAMLDSTGGMTKNMGSIEGGISILLRSILEMISSLTAGGSGGGLFGSLLGSIFGLIGGPIGSAIGGVLGSGLNLGGLFGSSHSGSNFRQMPLNNLTARNPNIINQVVIKNPVTFSKAYDVEVRNRIIRGGIDL
jgi:hypothetical protein